MTEPVVSIVVVAWRAREHVLSCLASLERHVTLPYEAVVVDDGSGDGTPDAVRASFPAARVVAKERNEGLAAGRNTAVREVRGRLVLMLDADTEVTPGAVEELARVLDEDAGVGIAAPKLVFPDGTLQLSCRRYPPFLIPFLRRGPYARLVPDPRAHRWHLMKDFAHDEPRPVVWALGAAQMWRRDLAALLGAYDERLSSYGGEDVDWCLRTWAAGLGVRYVPAAVVVHDYQQVTRRNLYGRKSRRQLRDWYYLQWKHRRLRRDPRLAAANA